jgi:hypothetical protein
MLFVNIYQIKNILNQGDFTVLRLIRLQEIFGLDVVGLDLSESAIEDVSWLLWLLLALLDW